MNAIATTIGFHPGLSTKFEPASEGYMGCALAHVEVLRLLFSQKDVGDELQGDALAAVYHQLDYVHAVLRKAAEVWAEEHAAAQRAPDRPAVLDEVDGFLRRLNRQEMEVHWVLSSSMEPTFRQGDQVILDRDVNRITHDGLYVMGWAGQRHVVRAQLLGGGSVRLFFENPSYQDQNVPLDDIEGGDVKVFGSVVAHIRRV